MITLNKFYFEPNFNGIKPIEFSKGINFIIGERSENPTNINEANKMNGVGKSMLIEMINFCLLKDLDNSRVSKIPLGIIPNRTYSCLEIEVETDNRLRVVTIKRNIDEKQPIVFLEKREEKEILKADEAKKYLESIVFSESEELERPSLRSMLSLLIRDEKTSYDNILFPYLESSKSFIDAVRPHLYLFGFDLNRLDKIRLLDKRIDASTKTIKSLKEDIEKEGVSPKEIELYLKELKDKAEKLDFSIKALHPGESIYQYKEEIQKLESQIRKIVSEKVSKEYNARQIKSLPIVEEIDAKEVALTYNQFKSGLGDFVQKSLEQVQEFQLQVQEFQNSLMREKLVELNKEIVDLEIKISELDEKIAGIYSKTDVSDKIGEVRLAMEMFRETNEKLERLSGIFNFYNAKKDEKKRDARNRQEEIVIFDAQITELRGVIKSFSDDLERAHQFIVGNKICSFNLEINEKKKEFIKFDYYTNRDGSSGVNRIKTFIYDVLLMLNKNTTERHLGFLIHDNIFASAGKDDMIKSLNYLNDSLSKRGKFQYILTINKDEFESSIDGFNFNYQKKIRGTFTREKPFLNKEYREA